MERKYQALTIEEKEISRIRDELIRQVQALAKKLGKTPTSLEFYWTTDIATPAIVRKYFGSWNQLLIQAGFTVNRVAQYTDAELIAQIQMLTRELDKVPTLRDFNNDPRTAHSLTAKNHFGSWSNFLSEANIDIDLLTKHAKERLIVQVQILAAKLGRTPRIREFKAASQFSIKKYFGSWSQFLIEANLKSNNIMS